MRLARFAIATTTILAALGCSSLSGGGDEPLDAALIRTVEKGDLVDEVSESGRIGPSFEVEIKSKVSGEIEQVLVEEGAVVEKGQPLYDLVDTDYERDVQLSRVQLQQARLKYDNAVVQRDRNEKAYAARGVSGADVDLARRQVDLAKTDVEAAKVNLATSQDRLNYAHVVAPISGVVIVRNIEPGEMVTAGVTATVNGEPALTIAQMDTLELELDLNQVDVAKVKVDQNATLLLDAYPGVEVPGRVSQIAAAGHTDSTRGIDVFTVKVEVDPAKSTVPLKPGMTAEVRIRVAEYADVVKLPSETIFEEDGKSFVYLVKGEEGKETKEKTAIEIGHRSDREVEVTSGISAGDKYYAQADVKDFGAKFD